MAERLRLIGELPWTVSLVDADVTCLNTFHGQFKLSLTKTLANPTNPETTAEFGGFDEYRNKIAGQVIC